MPCDVHLYDSSFSNLTSSYVSIGANNKSTGVNLSLQTNSVLTGGKYGAILAFSKASIVYSVFTHDPFRTYAPTLITDLNGNETGLLDLVVYPVPKTGGSGNKPTTSQEISAYVQRQNWNEFEKMGIFSLINTVRTFKLWTNLDPNLFNYRLDWENQLLDFGIKPSLI
jgi:hypothetical protein